MITGELHIDDTLTSVGKLAKAVHGAMERAVLNTAHDLMSKIVSRTLAPAPPPPVQYYVRTNRLVSGWGPAANFLGLEVPGVTDEAEGSNEGRITFSSSAGEIVFQAINDVPYAAAVELAGTWKTPFPSRRPPYGIVLTSSQKTEGEFVKNVSREWSSL